MMESSDVSVTRLAYDTVAVAYAELLRTELADQITVFSGCGTTISGVRSNPNTTFGAEDPLPTCIGAPSSIHLSGLMAGRKSGAPHIWAEA